MGGVAGALLVGREARGVADVEAALLEMRARTATEAVALEKRLEALERAASGGGAVRGEDVAAAARALAEDVARLREAHVRDLQAADARLWALERRVDELAALAALAPTRAENGPPSEQEEGAWVAVAREDDPGRRFSALAILGRWRTDRSVQASRRALADADEGVVWQALRNLARFEDRAAAREVAALLAHDRVAIRGAAHDALRRFGAPDVGFDAAALPEKRKPAAEKLRHWAEESP